MRNQGAWKPSKFVHRRGRLIASRDTREVDIASRLTADLIAASYDRLLPLHARGRLLDLGCGKVPLYATYQRLVSDCVCVDWANTAHKNSHLDLECDLSNPLPFADREFDTIILSDVLEHVPNPEGLWMEMSRVLAVGGKVIMNVPFFYWLHEEPHDYYRYTEYCLRRFVGVAGLELVSLEPTGGSPEVMADILAKNIVHVPTVGPPLSVFIQAATAWIVRTHLGRRISRKTSRRFPFGYFVVALRSA